MSSLGFNLQFWNLFLFQIPFLICATWILPREWAKIKMAFREKVYHQIWLVVFLNLTFGLLLNFLLPNEVIPSQLKFFQEMGLFATFLLTCLIAPIAEECFFRYLIFNNFKKNNLLPYLLSFFGFIFMHIRWFSFVDLNSLISFFSFSLFTFYLIYIYRQSDWNLAFPIVVHFLNNLTIFLSLLLKNKIKS